MTEWRPHAGDRKRVVVVGAGVAGMTAAHELVERGYEVEVVEMVADPYDRRRRQVCVGGMARTSWARVPSPGQGPLGAAFTAPPGPIAPVSRAGRRILCDDKPLPITVPLLPVFGGTEPRFDAFVDALSPGENLLVITSVELVLDQEDVLRALLSGHNPVFTVSESSPSDTPWLQLSVAGARVPGEHGFRFFPSFYYHLFDTMKRIPIPEAAIANARAHLHTDITLTSDSSRSVFDALLSAEVIQIGLDPAHGRARSFEIPRRQMRSLPDLRALFGDVLERAGYRGQDLYRLITRYAEYLTSSADRRADYEAISWADFLGLDAGYGATFARHVNSGAQALVAMSSKTNDARTIGSIAMQLTLDQIRANPGGYTDATLRGPTSLELFEPWRAYLESQSVRFTRAQLIGFYGRGMALRPAFGIEREGKFRFAKIAPADYYVITIPIDKFQSLFTPDGDPVAQWRNPQRRPPLCTRDQLRAANGRCLALDRLEHPDLADPPGEDPDDIAKVLDFALGDVAARPDDGPLRYMCGIQFYFDGDVKMIVGHTLCLDSPWGVSHISQVQYWQDRARGQSGVRGVISAIFTIFSVRACDLRGEHAKTALECNHDELAERVWKQIVDAWDVARFGTPPHPQYYYVDDSLSHDGATWRNDTPYLVNRVGDWPRRGGVRISDSDYAYRIQLGHTVFAGAFMRTSTRLNTMEAANESGRRAVNAILDHDRAPLQRVRLFNLEDHELPEVQPLRALDARIARRGGHHLLRHAGVEAALRAVPWDLVRLGLPTRGEKP